MKNWFPFTSYDFYAYLTTGMVVLAAFDRAFMDSFLANETEWGIVVGVFWAAIAYLIGHIIAMPSSAILEHWIAKRVLLDPSAVILGLKERRKRERWLGKAIGAREYEPFSPEYSKVITTKLCEALGVQESKIEAEAAFQCAFPRARSVTDSAKRMDDFQNLYGMCRNVSFASFVGALFLTCLAIRTGQRFDTLIAVGAAALSLGLFMRFVKFYAAYTREVFRAFEKAHAVPRVG